MKIKHCDHCDASMSAGLFNKDSGICRPCEKELNDSEEPEQQKNLHSDPNKQ